MQLYKACEAYQTTYVEWTWTELWSAQIKDQAKETFDNTYFFFKLFNQMHPD